MLSVSKPRSSGGGSVHEYYGADDYYSQNNDPSLINSNGNYDGNLTIEASSNQLNHNEFLDESSSLNNNSTINDQVNLEDKPNLRAPSFWFGKLAKELGLEGQINGKILDDLTNGILPNGVIMQGKVNQDGEEIHDRYRDITFSAPKSVSILSEVLEVESLNQIHNLAVEKTLNHIQENYSYTRVKVGGKVSKQLTGNMLFGSYVHNTSRALDPQLHTHCLALNITKREDGNYRTMFFDPIFDDYKQLGLIYRSNLAFELQKAGFTTEVNDHAQGFFEIKGLPRELIDIFSSRRNQIEEKIKELGYNSAKAKEVAALLTRDKKNNIANDVLKSEWNETLKEVLLNLNVKIKTNPNDKEFDKVFRTSLKKNWKQNLKDNFADIIEEKLLPLLNLKPKTSSKPVYFAKDAVERAIKSLSERSSVFTEKQLLQRSLKNGLGKTNFEHINQEIKKSLEKQELIVCSSIGLNNYLATPEALKTELKIIEATKESLKPENYITPVYSSAEIKELSNNEAFSSLNKGQQKACISILNSPQRIIAIQGYAGTGKTTMLKPTFALLATKKVEMLGLAPTGTAVKELQNVGINSRTLQWFLGKYSRISENRATLDYKQESIKELKNKIVIVDESSLISSKQMSDLTIIEKELGFKLVLMGDTKQENAVGAGNPFYQMQKNGLKTVTMDEIVRQKNQTLKTSVYNVIKASDKDNLDKGYIKKAFENIDNIVEVKLDIKPSKNNKETELDKIKQRVDLINKISKTAAKHYVALDKKARDETLILSPSNETRTKINEYIRQIFKESGELGSKMETREILINQSLDESQKQQINTYKIGDVIRFGKSYKTNNIIKDTYYKVFAKDVKRGNIYLTDSLTKKEVVWNPSKLAGARQGVVEVYHQEKREFTIGEKINFTRGFLDQNIVNSESATIKDFTERSVILEMNKQNIEISKQDPILNHIDYGYGYTVHRAQGKTVDNVIAVLESYRPQLTTQKSFYVEISRARHNATLILDRKEKIIETLEKTTGEKISIVDLLNAKNLANKLSPNLTSKIERTTGQNLQTKQKTYGNHSPSKSEKTLKDNAPKERKSKYIVHQFTTSEIKEYFTAAIKSQTKINPSEIDDAVSKSFDGIGQKIRFGNKKENEICWYGEAGYFKSFKTGEILKWGVGNIANKSKFKTISKTEFELKQKQAEEIKQKFEQQKFQEKLDTAKKAEQYFNSYPENNRLNAVNNKYLINKGIVEAKNILGIKFTKDNQIVIPLRDTNNKIHSLQYVDQDGNKKFLKNGEKQGNFFLIAQKDLNKTNEIYLAEGFATAASIHMATNKPVAVCFDAGNIEHVLKNLKSAHPDKQFTITADNDPWKENNIGKEKAVMAAKKYGAKVILPIFKDAHHTNKPTDFNDLHKLAGITEVKKQISSNHYIQHDIISKNTGFDL